MTQELWRLLVSALARRFSIEEYPRRSAEWALAALEAGMDSRSLRIVAALDAGDTWPDVDRHLRNAADELRFALPSHERGIELHARFIAEDIVSGKLNALVGCRVLYTLSLQAHHDSEFLWEWSGLDYVVEDARRNVYGTLADAEAQIRAAAERMLREIPPPE